MGERAAAGPLAWGTLASPVGELQVGCSPAGVARVNFGRGARPAPPPSPSLSPAGAPAAGMLAVALEQLAGYFAGQRRDFELPVDFSGVPGTQQRVLQELLESAGYGQTITYGELARRSGLAADAGAGGSRPAGPHDLPARVVGQVMGANRCPIVVPCHRVVAGNGLGGYSGGTGVEVKRWLLTFEGALPPTLDWDPAGPARPL